MASGNLTAVPGTFQEVLKGQSQVLCSGGRTKDNCQTETRLDIGKPHYSHKDTPTVQQVALSSPVSILQGFQDPAG